MNSTSTARISARLYARVATAALAVSAIAMTAAATAQDGGSSGGLILPDNPAFFAKNDPNLRKATVIVNGEIITGTDVDQRVALIVNASGNKVSDEELGRLKLQVLRNLMDETLQIQEARAQKVEVDNSEVDQTFARIAQQNFGQDVKAMEAYLPGGTSLQVHALADAPGAVWTEVPYLSSSAMTAGVMELTYELQHFAAERLRLRVTVHGSFNARPWVTNLRAVVL